MNRFIVIAVSLLFAFGGARVTCAQDAIIEDRNGDDVIEILAFGDSITYGVGDGIAPGEYVEEIFDLGTARGYPLRLSSLLGIAVSNAGVPGEGLSEDGSETGAERFPSVVVGSAADLVIIKEGINDAERLVSDSVYVPALQRVINVARADGKTVVLSTIATPTGLREQYAPFSTHLSAVIRDIGAINSLPVVDIEALFQQACPIYSQCSYYNLPEGLHPNTLGYDAIAAEMARVLQGG